MWPSCSPIGRRPLRGEIWLALRDRAATERRLAATMVLGRAGQPFVDRHVFLHGLLEGFEPASDVFDRRATSLAPAIVFQQPAQACDEIIVASVITESGGDVVGVYVAQDRTATRHGFEKARRKTFPHGRVDEHPGFSEQIE